LSQNQCEGNMSPLVTHGPPSVPVQTIKVSKETYYGGERGLLCATFESVPPSVHEIGQFADEVHRP